MTRRIAGIALTLFASMAGTARAGIILNLQTIGDIINVADNSSTSNTWSVTNGAVLFDFTVPTAIGPAFTSQNGLLNFTATSSQAATGPDGASNYDQSGYTGSGTITDTTAGAFFNTVVFSFTFGPQGSISVAANGPGGTFFDSTPPLSEVQLSSPLINFGAPTSQSWSYSLSGNSNWTLDGSNFLNNNTTGGTITFSSVPTPSGSPEPGTMLLVGAALVGVGVFRGKRFVSR